MATTPPEIAVNHTPATPRHAGGASRHYSTRKNTRYTVTRSTRAAETPPPETDCKASSTKLRKTSSPHSSAVPPHSPPSSTPASPRKKTAKRERARKLYVMEGGGMCQGDQTHESQSSNDVRLEGKTQQANASHMLPTPASIPRKKTVPKNAVDAAARVLFPVRPDNIDDAMPTPRKNRKSRKHVGFSLYSSMEDDGTSSEEKIQIYTDSKEKVPEMDIREDNPFLERPPEGPPPPEPVKAKTSKKRKLGHGVETNPQIEEAFNRDEGLVYVFRGKKMYRKFPQDSESEREETSTADDPNPSTLRDPEVANLRPLTRSSIKPRLLFPTPQQRAERTAAAIADEEAPTDIEDHAMTQPEDIVTPVKKSFAPATPPPTGHATRSSTKKARDTTLSPSEMDDDMMEGPAEKRKKVSPFDGWARTKAGASGEKGRKREGETMEKGERDGGKRIKNYAAT